MSTPTISAAAVVERLAAVRHRIEAAGGDPDRVSVLAVTKGFGPDAVRAAVGAGLTQVGENYAQELVAKASDLEPHDGGGPAWHFIGRMQRNKVRLLAPHVSTWQSVDRPELGVEIAKRAPGARVLVQVAVADEPGKGGCPPDQVGRLVDDLRDAGLDVAGLMAVGATGGGEVARPGFRLLRRLADDLGLHEVSMGMSGDLEAAVQEGSTMVRVGTAIFGPRAERKGMRN